MFINPVPRTENLDSLVEVSSYFQRAVHLRYDLGNPEAIARYVPTIGAAEAISSIISGTGENASQRAHVLHAAYGSGKSLLAVVMAAILERDAGTKPQVDGFVNRLSLVNPEIAEQLSAVLRADGPRLLPVVLVGDEGDITLSLPRALARSLKRAEITLELPTRFDAALKTISLWEEHYPDTYTRLADYVGQRGSSLDEFCEALAGQDPQAFQRFENLYTLLSAGAVFDPFQGQAVDMLFRETAQELANYGYDGIAVLWDEFGRYLDARITKAFSNEAALLQGLAEICNYSGNYQVHLLLFAHKELQSYAASNTLPKNYQQEWSRIEGRFQRHDVTSDLVVSYQLIASVFSITDEERFWLLLQRTDLDDLVSRSLDSRIFGLFDAVDIRKITLDTWPLHPLTVFSLARLSNRVAQNERTMFTFLAADERFSLRYILAHTDTLNGDYFVRISALWDYFEDAIRADSGVGGAHKAWSGVINALDKVAREDRFTIDIVKTIGVLLIVADGGQIRPTTDLICWAVGADSVDKRAAVVQSLENLRRRKVIINRQIDGYWNFTSGSDIDFEQRLNEVLERINPSPIQLRRMLEKQMPPAYIVARRYNQDYAMTRFFTSLYRWPEELAKLPWDKQIEKLDHPDGIVVYVLATDELAVKQAHTYVPEHERVVLAIPDEPLVSLQHLLRELFGLYELNNDPLLKRQEDRERIQRELDWLIEDAEERLRRVMAALVDPRSGQTTWCTYRAQERMHSPGQATRFVSEICQAVFPATPVINNEGVNKKYPTKQQLRASEKVIDALFSQPPSELLGLTGRGPEILVCNTLLVMPGILCEEAGEWMVARPQNNDPFSEIWDLIAAFLTRCHQDGPQPVKILVDRLTVPPYGLREGLIPVLIAAVLRDRLKATTIRQDKKAIHPINGELMTKMIYSPDTYSVEVGEWNENLERLWNALETRFENYIYDIDRHQEPLSMMKVAMLRWLQSLPRFCRDTMQLSGDVLLFRNLIRKAQIEPATVISKDMPQLLDLADGQEQGVLEAQIDSFMSALSTAYLDLQKRLDTFAMQTFSVNSSKGRVFNGLEAIKGWVAHIEVVVERPIADFRFGSPTTQAFVDTLMALSAEDDQPWDQLSHAVTGLHLRDWIDKSEEKFYHILTDARSEVEIETQSLLEEDSAAVSVSVHLPGENERDFRFRSADLSKHGESVLQNLRSTLEIAGRPLSLDEKRQIAVELLRFVMGDTHDE